MTQRRGFTLVEVLISLVVMGLVTGAIYKLLTTNQRLAVAQAEQVSLQSNVRTGSLVVPSELRELNTVTGGDDPQIDVIDADPDGVQYRAARGLGLLCQDPGAGPGPLVVAQSSWTGVRAPDQNRDSLYLFIDGDVDEDEDDTWLQMDVTNVVLGASACGAGLPGWTLTVDGNIPGNVPANTPVRLFEVMRLQLTPDGGQWWLGAQSLSALDPAVTPVLGPLTNNGFALEYFDSTGVPTADRSAIKSIRITVRGVTDGVVRAGGAAAADYSRETLATQVLLRNSVRPE